MIFTRQEIKQLLKNSCEKTSLDVEVLYNYMLDIMDWTDDDARDITGSDVDSLADFIARDADGVLLDIEKRISSSASKQADGVI
jgi:hypothetical protein